MITNARVFDDNRSHFYSKEGKPVHVVPNKSKPGEMRPTTVKDARKLNLLPSPTTICKLLHREALVAWKVEQAVLAAITSPRRPEEDVDAFIERVLHTDREQDQERDAAAMKGRAIHEAIKLCLDAGWPSSTFQGDLLPYVNPAINELLILGRPVATEKIIVADTYAGCTDVVLDNPEEIWVVDFKCTRSIPDAPYREQRLQLAAYAGGLGNTGNKRIRCANMYISTKEPGVVKTHEIKDWERDLKCFRLLVEFWNLINKMKD